MIYTILPSQKEVYESMVSGRHLCIEDGEPFSALSRNEEDYKALFTGLGMELVSDPRGFYYLEGSRIPANVREALYFMAILFEHLDESGCDLEETVFGTTFFINDLPHLSLQRYAEVMDRVAGIKDADGLRSIITSLARYRFLVMDGPDGFHFRVTAHRLIDFIRDAKNKQEQIGIELANTGNEEAGL